MKENVKLSVGVIEGAEQAPSRDELVNNNHTVVGYYSCMKENVKLSVGVIEGAKQAPSRDELVKNSTKN